MAATMSDSPWVLVAEDDDDTREALAEAVGFAGYEVRAAADGEAALEHVRELGLPSVILLDMHMPKLDAAGFLQVFRRSAEASMVPVVLLTAVANAEALPGCFALLLKPFHLEELLHVLGRAAYGSADGSPH